MRGADNQLSRYGAIAQEYPMVTGKAFFLVSSTEAAYQFFANKYPADADGQARVYTSWAAVISAVQQYADNDVIIVSPLFTTAPSKAQQLQLDAAGCLVIQAGQVLPDGSYIAATQTALSLASSTTNSLFQVNGRVRVISVLGEVVTT